VLVLDGAADQNDATVSGPRGLLVLDDQRRITNRPEAKLFDPLESLKK
jgi:hypothetical protein